MPALERLSRAYRGRGLLVTGVNLKNAVRDVRRFAEDCGLTFRLALDDGAVGRALRVRGLPMTILVDRDGTTLWRALGARDWDGRPACEYFDRLVTMPRSSGEVAR